MVFKQPIRSLTTTTIREIRGHRYRFLGQLEDDGHWGRVGELLELFLRVGVRLYQDVDSGQQYLCVESAQTGDERWYRIDGSTLTPENFGDR